MSHPLLRARALVALAGVALLVAAGCSGGIGGGGSNAASACTLIARLAEPAAALERVDKNDPDAFDQALRDAVAEFSDTIDSLQKVTPDSLHRDLQRLKAAAQQYRFDDAVDARSALDDYARRALHRELDAHELSSDAIEPPIPEAGQRLMHDA